MLPYRLSSFVFRALVPLAFAAACSATPQPVPETPGTIIVGVQGQPGLASLVASYRVVATVGAREAARTVLTPTGAGKDLLPYELALTQLAGEAAAPINVVVEAFSSPIAEDGTSGGQAPLLTKIAATRFVAAETKLLRLRLEAQCITSSVPGFFGPTCTAPQTCHQGRCVDGTVPAEDLEPYTPGWASDGPDICKPSGAGAPELLVGTGQTDYLPLQANETLEAERGPQGGHHLWIAVRMKNLKQSGSMTTITGVQPGTGVTVPPTSFVFTYDRDEGGFCKIFGLRYQLDNASNPVQTFLGKPLDVTVEVKDVTGAKASATIRVNVATTLRG